MKAYIVLFFMSVASWAFAQSYQSAQGTVTIKGTSNLHDWESYAKEVRINANVVADANNLKSIQNLSVDIPVKSIKSPKGSIMDGKTYDALNAKNFPNITYKLEKVTSLNRNGDHYDINASGYLTIAGTTNRIDLYVKGKLNGDGGITFSGSKKLKMTDYKIDPPTALFGTLTTGDDIEVSFQVTIKQYNN
jgi:polyisoprenoid-binding protein YceI